MRRFFRAVVEITWYTLTGEELWLRRAEEYRRQRGWR